MMCVFFFLLLNNAQFLQYKLGMPKTHFIELLYSENKLIVLLPVSDQGFASVFSFVFHCFVGERQAFKNVLLNHQIK